MAQEGRPIPSLSALLADDSIDRTGAPIHIEYQRLREPDKLLCQVDLEAVHRIAHSAAVWEFENGVDFKYTPGPIDHGHPGLLDAKLVPVKLNVGEGEALSSLASYEALKNNDFCQTNWTVSHNLTRWRFFSFYGRINFYPSHYIVWRDCGRNLYARIPKPLGGMSRGGCDHCWIHDQNRVKGGVTHFDNRSHVDRNRTMTARQVAITPLSLCRFHWWYVWSGELLRESQVHALEILVSGDLRERWGVPHMREFIRFMAEKMSLAKMLADFSARRNPHGRGPAQGAPMTGAIGSAQGELEDPEFSKIGWVVAPSANADQRVSSDQPANATTADGPKATCHSFGESSYRSSEAHGQKPMVEETSQLGQPENQRREAFDRFIAIAGRRHGPLKGVSYLDRPSALIGAQENNTLPIQGVNGASQPNSTPAPTE